MTISIVDRTFPIDPSALLPVVCADTAPYWTGLEQGKILTQRCSTCGTSQVPGSPVCAHCGSGDVHWERSSGAATLFAWVRYHRPYLPEFADILPYVSAVVELDCGARLHARLVNLDGDPEIGMPLMAIIERWTNGRCVPVFAPARMSGDRPWPRSASASR